MKLQELSLTSGLKVRVRRVPDYALINVASDIRLPQHPVEAVETVAGTEMVPARPGSPAYEDYQRQLEEAISAQERKRLGFLLAYGVVEWDDGTGWKSTVPDGWRLDELLSPFSTSYERGDYILFVLLTEAADIAQVVNAVKGSVTEEEIRSAEDFFRDTVPRR